MKTASLREPGRILFISCYEMGQQPLGLLQPASYLQENGFSPELLDIAVESLDEDKIKRARLVAISVPMHTALRLGTRVAKRVRQLNDTCHVCFYGLYAALNHSALNKLSDSCFGAEAEDSLLRLAESLEQDMGQPSTFVALDLQAEFEGGRHRRKRTVLPDRAKLPPLDRYVKLRANDTLSITGQVVTTRGCKHTCSHCPLPPVYKGRFYALNIDAVLADIAQLVDQGARHITFADADFLNGPTHATRVIDGMHDRFPFLSFDFTAKIEHLVRHQELVAHFKNRGCLFVVSAVESLSPRTLIELNKGHTPDDVFVTIRYFRELGLTLRPTFVPFTPWDTIDDYIELLRMVREEGLMYNIDPVQYSIRLLIPPGSLLLNSSSVQSMVADLDPDHFEYIWHHSDSRMDQLQGRIADIVAHAEQTDEAVVATFNRILAAVKELIDSDLPLEPADGWIAVESSERPPGLTESWFC